MTANPVGQTRRRRRVWPLILLTITVIMLVPELRSFVATYIGHAIAVVAGVFVTTLVLLGAGRTPPRR